MVLQLGTYALMRHRAGVSSRAPGICNCPATAPHWGTLFCPSWGSGGHVPQVLQQNAASLTWAGTGHQPTDSIGLVRPGVPVGGG